MSASLQIRSAGLGVLLAVSGETLTTGKVLLKALVNRSVLKPRDGIASKDGQLDFTVMGLSEIEIPFTTISLPVSGDVFADTMGFRHRVKYVTNTDLSWVLYCTQSKV